MQLIFDLAQHDLVDVQAALEALDLSAVLSRRLLLPAEEEALVQILLQLLTCGVLVHEGRVDQAARVRWLIAARRHGRTLDELSGGLCCTGRLRLIVGLLE